MKDSEVYLRAAELCSKSDEYGYYTFSCMALGDLCGWAEQFDRLRYEYAELFKPIHVMFGESWFGSDFGEEGARNSNYRVLALCFMAAIAKSEGR